MMDDYIAVAEMVINTHRPLPCPRIIYFFCFFLIFFISFLSGFSFSIERFHNRLLLFWSCCVSFFRIAYYSARNKLWTHKMYWYFDFSCSDCNSAQRKLFISIISVNVILNPRHQVQRLMHWPSFAHSQTIAALALIIVAAVAAGSILYPPIFSYDTVADSWHSSSKFNWFHSNLKTILICLDTQI